MNLVRYADDFIITANSKETAEELKELVSVFLSTRGLTLSEEKTLITQIDDGFDFLGWNFRKFKGKLIVKPSKNSVKNVIHKCSKIILKDGKAMTQKNLIQRLNAVLRGWTNYHKHVVASRAFSIVNNSVYLLLQQWAKHRHPNKNKWWHLKRYWHEYNGKPWVFMTGENVLINLRRIHIKRHQNLCIDKNPFLDKTYFIKRRMKLRSLSAA
ncbi:group II intron maturase-specific domain-containing protein [Clostridium sp. E02]|uniref:group II intron maturase-specific domain-containing protein n=1 Tax=Clostridium sp. E02 TaxID=2487134 RepID=UPI001FAA1222|nr:group II intron maturase-specific domain-containing protein [Clostridium sp. E02]